MEVKDTQFGVELLRLARRCRGIDKLVSASVGLSVDEMHCLSVLFSEKPSSVKTLSEMINVTPTRASKILRDLEQRAFVSRSHDIADHRREHVLLTEEGRRIVEKLLSLYSEIGIQLARTSSDELSLDVAQLLHGVSHSE